MSCCLTTLLCLVLQSFGVVIAAATCFLVFVYSTKMLWRKLFPEQNEQPDGYKEQWYGKEPEPLQNDGISDRIRESLEDTSVRPFKIDVPEEILTDLKSRLDRTRYEDPVKDSKFQYGFNPKYLKQVVDYWRKEYDWRTQEKMLNQFPQFKTSIEGLEIHFMHVKPKLPADSKLKVLPIMVIHGWPGSVVEFYKLIPLLTTPRPGRDFVFEVICPSIPGYGFSESPYKKGFNIRAAARIFLTLMDRIGHRKFYVQGGDWGSAISNIMARCYPERILGLHVNMLFGGTTTWENIKFLTISFLPFLVSKTEYKLAFPIKRILKVFYNEGGYFHLQTTKPDTIGCATCDSPAGMAAYLLEKFSYWVNPEYLNLEDGGLTEKFSMDELLTNVMMYWVNNNFTAAARFYKENLSSVANREKAPITVPTGVAAFPNELMMLPKTCLSQQVKNLVSYNIMPRGGHFAAFEEPELLADDIWKFVSLTKD